MNGRRYPANPADENRKNAAGMKTWRPAWIASDCWLPQSKSHSVACWYSRLAKTKQTIDLVQQRHAAPEEDEKWLRPAVNKLLPCVNEFRRKKSNATRNKTTRWKNKLSNRIAKESIGGVSLKISSFQKNFVCCAWCKSLPWTGQPPATDATDATERLGLGQWVDRIETLADPAEWEEE